MKDSTTASNYGGKKLSRAMIAREVRSWPRRAPSDSLFEFHNSHKHNCYYIVIITTVGHLQNRWDSILKWHTSRSGYAPPPPVVSDMEIKESNFTKFA